MFNAERACTDTQVHYFYPQLTSISIVVRNLESGWLEYLRGVDDKPPLGTHWKDAHAQPNSGDRWFCARRNNGIASTSAIERVMIWPLPGQSIASYRNQIKNCAFEAAGTIGRKAD
jgi:hypothetical protein